jgi:hypothetical protein
MSAPPISTAVTVEVLLVFLDCLRNLRVFEDVPHAEVRKDVASHEFVIGRDVQKQVGTALTGVHEACGVVERLSWGLRTPGGKTPV